MSKRLALIHPLDSSALELLGECRKDAGSGAAAHRLETGGYWTYREEVAETVGVSEKTIREWVATFNEEGVSSLRYDKHKGKISSFTPELAEAIRKGTSTEYVGIAVA